MIESFKDFYFKSLLSESPLRVNTDKGDLLNITAWNQEDAADKLKDKNYKIIPFNFKDISFNIARDSREGSIYDYFIDKTPLIKVYYFYKVDKNNDMYMLGVWNYKMSPGFARALFFDYYLLKFNSITSDTAHTPQGEIFWKKLIDKAISLNKRITTLYNDNEENYDSSKEYWTKENISSHYKIRIYS